VGVAVGGGSVLRLVRSGPVMHGVSVPSSILDSMEITLVAPFETRPEFDEAVAQAADAARAFYLSDQVVMVDADYDLLVDRIVATREVHPDWDDAGVSTTVAAGQGAGGDVHHSSPMLSLAKTKDVEPSKTAIRENKELNQFLDQGGRTGQVVEVKLDGNAISVTYANGRLARAATRGDGRVGEDVTPNVLRGTGVKGLPKVLNEAWSGEVRGEVFMSDEDFEIASDNRVAAGGSPFANPRNAVSGSLRALDRTYEAPMSFGAYSIHDTSGATTGGPSHTQRMELAASMGFQTAASLTPGTPFCSSASDAKFQIVNIKMERDNLGFPIDGAVISFDGDADRDRLGEGSRVPRWAMAWKYPPREGVSTITDVAISIGRTGRMSLTLHYDAISLDGSVLAKASGHNPTWMAASGIGVGHKVMVVKRGDIIPYASLLAVPENEAVSGWVAPESCPQCAEEWDKSSLLWRCHTAECSIAGRLAYFCSRDAMDIDGVGVLVAEALSGLVDDEGQPVVTSVADLYDLSVSQWAALPMGVTSTGSTRMLGEANAAKIVASLEASKAQPLNRLVTALGIRMTGRSVGRWLASAFPTMESLRAASVADVAAIERLGEVKATHIVNGLAALGPVLDRLSAHGLNMGAAPVDDGTVKPFTGHTYVVSGAVPGFTRTTIAEAIEALGGRASSSVSKTTTALVTAEEGTSKAKKAASLGIPVIDPVDFLAMMLG
jgi:DNA ligase (NAD+)